MSQAAPTRDERRASRLLAAGATLGLLVAAAHLLVAPGSGDALPAGAVARVEGRIIRAEHYQRLVAALAADRRTPLSDDDRRRVLDRLIEEELLVRHGLDLGLADSDRRVRADLVSAVLASITASVDGYEPEADAVVAFYADNTAYFARPARLRVRRIFVRRGDAPERARARAEEAAARLRGGEPIDAVRAALGDTVLAPVPDAPLPPTKLREYLGPTGLAAALALAPGEVSDPVETPQGFDVLLLVEGNAMEPQPLERVHAQVVAEMKRREGDRRLRGRLDELREDADVQVTAELPAAQ